MTTNKKSNWMDELQEAAPAVKSKAKNPAPAADLVALEAQPVLTDIRVIVRDARKAAGGDVHPMALRMPTTLLTRLDKHIAGQRHAAILALIEFGIDELVKQKKVLEVK